MPGLVFDPTKIRQFGEPNGATFCLVTNPEWVDQVEIIHSDGYAGYRVIPFEGGDAAFARLMQDEVPQIAHVLVMSPERFFQSPDDAVIGPRRKLLAMACNSTPTDLQALHHFLRCIEDTDPDAQERFSDRFFELAERGDVLRYTDAEFGTVATLRLFDKELVWNQQAGLVDWGEQQIVPSGEISVLPIEITEFDEQLSLPLDGEIVIRGYPILHSGTPSFSRKDQHRLHEQFWLLREHPVKAKVEDGVIVDLAPLDKAAGEIADVFDALFTVDSRYRMVWEIGHAMNTTHEILSGNHAMNEVYGGSEGCLHWGLGLTPYTQYHLDIISPGTVVSNEQGDVMLGTAGQIAPERVAEVPAGAAS